MDNQKIKCPICGAMDDRFTVRIIVGNANGDDMTVCEDCASTQGA